MTAAGSRARLPLRAAARGAMAWWLGELAGFVPARLKGRHRRADADIRLDSGGWTMRDRRGGATSIEPRDTTATAQAFAALRGQRKQIKATLTVPLSRCFRRQTELPRAMLGHARDILASELEIATPFHAGNTHWDFFVDGDGQEPGTVAVTQIVLKRRDTEVLAQRLGDAGIPIVAITVEDDRAGGARLPVDLQRHDRRGGTETAGLRKARSILIAAAILTSVAIVPAAFSRQSAILASLDQDITDATDAVAARPGLARAPLQALGEALQAKRNLPPATAILNGLATTLPPGSSLDHFFLDKDVLTIQGRTASIHNLERALSGSPLFAAGHNTAPASAGGDGIPFTVRLKIKPMPQATDA